MFNNPPTEKIKSILQNAKNIAIVGLSPKPQRPSFQVASALQSFGYRTIPVRPAIDSILGERVYPDLDVVQETIDIVNVFRAPQHVGPIVDKCIKHKFPVLWLQLGVVNEAEALRAQDAGIIVVMDRCIHQEYLKLIAPDK